uniref:inorganic phosphate transporter n=1 Tax=Vaginimicrobium propionicum TaxID=1871034 RepID=UPI0009F93B91|nr:inorganic phosphate transporter [Vaginimicrobium propionicum]
MLSDHVLLALVIITALGFDFTNGFHDTANAMATSIATKALRPRAAVTLCALLNLVGAFLSVEVALTVTNAVINIQNPDGTPRADLTGDNGSALLLILLAGLVGGIIWNLFTWLRGLPSSSSHALFGGLVGSAIAGLGFNGVKWIGENGEIDGVVGKVIVPGLISPLVAIIITSIGVRLVFRVVSGAAKRYVDAGFRWAQIGSASLVSLSHGTNDAQKTMGVVTLALIASGNWAHPDAIPVWVKILCAAAIATGTYIGGWRIIRTLGKGLVEITPAQGFAAECASAAVILASSHWGFALSTTHVATGSILGSGLGRPGAKVRWRLAGQMFLAWLTTLPCAAVIGAATWYIGNALGPVLGGITIFLIMAALAAFMYRHSQSTKVNSANVNDDWQNERDLTGATARTDTPAINLDNSKPNATTTPDKMSS